MYVVKCNNGEYAKGRGSRPRTTPDLSKAKVFTRKCDASNSDAAINGEVWAVTVTLS
jgi:hypothetical protein